MKRFKVGDKVILKHVPNSLIHDLPPDEQAEILSFVGRSTEIAKVDDHGFYWVGFGSQTEIDDQSSYSGHSFSVSEDCLDLLES